MVDLNLDNLRVVDLKNELDARNLPTNGLKAELRARLENALEEERKGSEPPKEEPASGNASKKAKYSTPAVAEPKREKAPESENSREKPSPKDEDTREQRDAPESPSAKRHRGDSRSKSHRSRSRHRESRDRSKSHRRSNRSRPRSKSPRHDYRDRHRDRSRDRYLDDRDRRGRDRDRGHRGDYRSRRGRSRSRDRRSSRREDRHRRSQSRRHRDGSGRDVTPLHLRQREMNLWDQKPPGFENVSASQAKLTGYFPPPGQLVGSRNVASFNPSVLQSLNNGDRDDPKKQAMLRQNRRIYVGNIPYGINEDAIAHFFNTTMIQHGIAPPDEPPVQSVQINVEKNYAFVEFRTPEQATRGMALDGANFQSQSLKIRRPKDYIPPSGGEEPIQPIHIPGVVSTNVADTPYKIYVGGLPNSLQEEQVIELLSTFGELRSFNLVKDTLSGMSRGFAFCEYVDPNITDVACQGLNGMELGDRRLVVQRASIGARQNNPLPGMNPMTGGPAMSHAMLPININAENAEPTNILQLLNMVTTEELNDDEEYLDIVEDVKEECGKFGQVIDIRIPRPSPDREVPGLGKIFVVYPNTEQSGVAQRALAGRKFADRTVLVSYVTKEDYDNENY